MIHLSNGVNLEDIWMIVDNLKRFKENMKCRMVKRWNAIKYKRRKKKCLTTLIPFDSLALSWTKSIRLRWFMSHFEDKV